MKTKLIPCKTCGHQIAKSASKCPSCGAARTNAARLVIIVIVSGLVGVWLFFRIAGG